MQIIDNTSQLLGDDLKASVGRGTRLRIAAACFSIYAFEALKSKLSKKELFETPVFGFPKPTKLIEHFASFVVNESKDKDFIREVIKDASGQGKSVFFVDDNALVACFESGITEELVKELAGHKPLRVVFRDNGFVSDAVKINVEQIFRQLSPTTEVKSL